MEIKESYEIWKTEKCLLPTPCMYCFTNQLVAHLQTSDLLEISFTKKTAIKKQKITKFNEK
jgi:hypothetical protein